MTLWLCDNSAPKKNLGANYSQLEKAFVAQLFLFWGGSNKQANEVIALSTFKKIC
tara:strand:- start:235 stop:399 length:165 start_codon:yes stop_codon:yes gene_type:complete